MQSVSFHSVKGCIRQAKLAFFPAVLHTFYGLYKHVALHNKAAIKCKALVIMKIYLHTKKAILLPTGFKFVKNAATGRHPKSRSKGNCKFTNKMSGRLPRCDLCY